jgi:hypothetical protein
MIKLAEATTPGELLANTRTVADKLTLMPMTGLCLLDSGMNVTNFEPLRLVHH